MFQMRFPNAKIIEDLAFFTEMKMRSMPEVSFKVNRWDPATGSKGALDVAWFRIKGIPYEKRSFPNVCLVASKVGLPLEVDRENMKKHEYVRVKIGCRDVEKVLAVVDGLLYFHFYDYKFQREVILEGYSNQAGNKWIRSKNDKDKEDEFQSPKKQKLNEKRPRSMKLEQVEGTK